MTTDATPILTIEHGASYERAPIAGIHTHDGPKLLWTSTATVTISTGSRDWLIPPGYGLWIPAGVPHAGWVLRDGEGSSMTFDPEHCTIAWPDVAGVHISPLLAELMNHLRRVEPGDPSRPAAEALMFTLLRPLPPHDIPITMPTDPRVRTIAERLIADPSDQRELAAWADFTHSSVRSLSRLFRDETGLSFAEWRTHVRVHAAIQKLATGTPVNTTARAVGYRRPSAFIAAFRRATGQTPGTYLADNP
ncbi:AraC family transcriptional regulator [Actinacidiphila alni]|uniref:AraC family transcriptional regulator n=1 Tax=Actinacidiphila alni TaxID=380248 RepID=UPI003455BF2B